MASNSAKPTGDRRGQGEGTTNNRTNAPPETTLPYRRAPNNTTMARRTRRPVAPGTLSPQNFLLLGPSTGGAFSGRDTGRRSSCDLASSKSHAASVAVAPDKESEVAAAAPGPKKEPEETNRSDANFQCNVCLETAVEPVVTRCGHLFCWECLYRWLQQHPEKSRCPVCMGDLADDGAIIPIYGRGGSAPSVDAGGNAAPPRPRAPRVQLDFSPELEMEESPDASPSYPPVVPPDVLPSFASLRSYLSLVRRVETIIMTYSTSNQDRDATVMRSWRIGPDVSGPSASIRTGVRPTNQASASSGTTSGTVQGIPALRLTATYQQLSRGPGRRRARSSLSEQSDREGSPPGRRQRIG